MRLWSLHPKYLDNKGLTALWREALLAKKALEGKTKGYKNHPQLLRFKKHSQPIKAINYYLLTIYQESKKRKYNFDKTKIELEKPSSLEIKISVNKGQLTFETTHLKNKLSGRDKLFFNKIKNKQKLNPHPIFKVVRGEIETWEKI